ncbi:MAG: hypothetical protein V4819_07775 [Verrucomicrobiota bacterium]
MAKLHHLIAISILAPSLAFAGPGLEQAEVKITYGELKTLITDATRPVATRTPPPPPLSALLSARFRLAMMDGKPVIDATFRTATFSDGLAMIPLVGGAVTVESQKPLDARILIDAKMLCQAQEKAGTQVLETRLLPAFGTDGASLVLPPCPAAVFETGELGGDRSVVLAIDGKEQVLGSNRLVALPLTGGSLEIRMLGGEETREALRPPEPSAWTWQHQVLVLPQDGEIAYRVLGRASAAGGSGVSAVLALPADAREVRVTGDDLAGHKVTRGTDRSLGLQIEWKTRGLLEREVSISYLLPRRPLDRSWKLQAPAGPGEDSTRTRFIILGSPELSYTAEGLTGPFSPKGLPGSLTEELKGEACYLIDAPATAELTVIPLPVVATAEATIIESVWAVKLEPDGAMLVEGAMSLEHRGALGLTLEVPEGMTLLACDVGGQAATPVKLGEGKLELTLPAAGQKTRVSCSFTGRTAALDPVEGTLELALPKTPLFIRALTWRIDLPRGYQAETHGNLIRSADPGDPPSRLTLRKNLCRDERPATAVFYQRSDLKN